ncbi:MAG: hypothetical protein K8R63_13770 [Bacteroidales bacterium]|nr:hypothetical protein [Bacteroidales bacterium]
MKKQLFIIITIFLTHIVYGQSSGSLSDQLWDQVQNCYSMIEDVDEDGTLDFDEIINDSKNGYLKVAVSWPTCGCNCIETVGAYKGSDGNYTILKKEEWGCSWVDRISSNRKLLSIFPENFGINTFIPDRNIRIEGNYALFYLDIEIPRIGTDTKVTIKTIPFGMVMENNDILCFGIFQKESFSNCNHAFYKIGSIARKIQNEQTLDFIINDQFEKISTHDMDIIKKTIGDNYSDFKSLSELRMCLKELKQTHDLYSLIEHETLLLGWNKEKSRFYIKEKGNHPKSMTFMEFLIENRYWSVGC